MILGFFGLGLLAYRHNRSFRFAQSLIPFRVIAALHATERPGVSFRLSRGRATSSRQLLSSKSPAVVRIGSKVSPHSGSAGRGDKVGRFERRTEERVRSSDRSAASAVDGEPGSRALVGMSLILSQRWSLTIQMEHGINRDLRLTQR